MICWVDSCHVHTPLSCHCPSPSAGRINQCGQNGEWSKKQNSGWGTSMYSIYVYNTCDILRTTNSIFPPLQWVCNQLLESFKACKSKTRRFQHFSVGETAWQVGENYQPTPAVSITQSFRSGSITKGVWIEMGNSMIPCKKDLNQKSEGYEGFRPLHHGSLGGPTGTGKETLDWKRRWFGG